MFDSSTRRFVLATFSAMAWCVITQGQDGEARSISLVPAEGSFNEQESGPEIELLTKVLGDFTRPMSSSSEEAQQFFDQGMQLKYAFAVADAAKSFREAQKRDPECAFAYWGEAWALGSYLNGPMSTANAPKAYAAIQKASELAGAHASPVEKAVIEAMTARYVEKYVYKARVFNDIAYAKAMRAVYDRFPDDLDVATIYAEALYLLQPRRGFRDLDDPKIQRLNRVLEGVLDVDIHHVGACHLYVHSTESSDRPELAEACAEFLGNSIPGASHINHMPSHTWNEVGRWGDSVRANIQASHSDLKAEFGEGIAIYPSHNLHMLLFAASMDGQGAVAIQAGRDYAKLTKNSVHLVLTLLRFGRFEEILEIEDRPKNEVQKGLWDFSQGYARLRGGEPDLAETYLRRVLEAAESSDANFRGHSAEHLLGTVGGILEGEIHRERGEWDQAISAFERAAAIEDELEYDEPEPLPFAARHWLGAALLEMERYPEAEQVYRDELEDHPHNGWSLWGLKEALRAQGKSSPDVDADFKASWGRSDTWIRTSRF